MNVPEITVACMDNGGAVTEPTGFCTSSCMHFVVGIALAQAVVRAALAMASFDKVCVPFVRVGWPPLPAQE